MKRRRGGAREERAKRNPKGGGSAADASTKLYDSYHAANKACPWLAEQNL